MIGCKSNNVNESCELSKEQISKLTDKKSIIKVPVENVQYLACVTHVINAIGTNQVNGLSNDQIGLLTEPELIIALKNTKDRIRTQWLIAYKQATKEQATKEIDAEKTERMVNEIHPDCVEEGLRDEQYALLTQPHLIAKVPIAKLQGMFQGGARASGINRVTPRPDWRTIEKTYKDQKQAIENTFKDKTEEEQKLLKQQIEELDRKRIQEVQAAKKALNPMCYVNEVSLKNLTEPKLIRDVPLDRIQYLAPKREVICHIDKQHAHKLTKPQIDCLEEADKELLQKIPVGNLKDINKQTFSLLSPRQQMQWIEKCCTDPEALGWLSEEQKESVKVAHLNRLADRDLEPIKNLFFPTSGKATYIWLIIKGWFAHIIHTWTGTLEDARHNFELGKKLLQIGQVAGE